MMDFERTGGDGVVQQSLGSRVRSVHMEAEFRHQGDEVRPAARGRGAQRLAVVQELGMAPEQLARRVR